MESGFGLFRSVADAVVEDMFFLLLFQEKYCEWLILRQLLGVYVSESNV